MVCSFWCCHEHALVDADDACRCIPILLLRIAATITLIVLTVTFALDAGSNFGIDSILRLTALCANVMFLSYESYCTCSYIAQNLNVDDDDCRFAGIEGFCIMVPCQLLNGSLMVTSYILDEHIVPLDVICLGLGVLWLLSSFAYISECCGCYESCGYGSAYECLFTFWKRKEKTKETAAHERPQNNLQITYPT